MNPATPARSRAPPVTHILVYFVDVDVGILVGVSIMLRLQDSGDSREGECQERIRLHSQKRVDHGEPGQVDEEPRNHPPDDRDGRKYQPDADISQVPHENGPRHGLGVDHNPCPVQQEREARSHRQPGHRRDNRLVDHYPRLDLRRVKLPDPRLLGLALGSGSPRTPIAPSVDENS